MTSDQLRELTDRLLLNPLFSTLVGRNGLVSQLPFDVRNSVNEDNNPKRHLHNILQVCSSYPGGWAEILKAIWFYDKAAYSIIEKYLVENGLLTADSDRPNAVSKPRSVHPLHKKYLERLVKKIGTINLGDIVADQSGGVPLADVYVDSPTPHVITVEVKDWRIVNWWLSRADQPEREREADGKNLGEPDEKRQLYRQAEGLNYKRAPREAFIQNIQQNIDDYRKRYPTKTPEDEDNGWRNGVHTPYINRLHLNELAAICDRLVILGGPGSGKSTFARYLALCLANAGLNRRGANLDNLGKWTHGVLTPVYVELRRFVASTHFPKTPEPPTADHFWEYIKEEWLGDNLQDYAESLRAEFENGYGLIILDGLDEVPYDEDELDDRRKQLTALARDLQEGSAEGSRLLVTSRPYAYEDWKLPGFEKVEIASFEDEHRKRLARQLYKHAGWSKKELENNVSGFIEQLAEIDKDLKDRPLFVTLLASLYLKKEGKGLPTNRATLYKESIVLLLERWTKGKPEQPPLTALLRESKTPQDLYNQLAGLACEVHKLHGEGKRPAEIHDKLLYDYLKPLSGRENLRKIYTYLCENAGVLVALGPLDKAQIFQFAHRSFQEYLAAEHIVRKCTDPKEDNFGEVIELITSKPDAWREPGKYLADILAHLGRKSDVWRLMGELVGDRDEAQPPIGESSSPQWWRVWLAATIAREHELNRQKAAGKIDKIRLDELVKWLVALLETPQALPPVTRAECGEVLALLGDKREGTGTRSVTVDGREIQVPDIKWCDIPKPEGGKFTMGSDSEKDNNPRREGVELNYNFQMAKYLITYRQFQTFAESGEYDNPDWWEGFPERYQRGQDLLEQYGGKGSHPRDRVSWYPAVAFTRWWTAKLRAAGELKSDQEIRLPTEIEWEYAARGTTEWRYPYSDEFDSAKGNTYDTGIGKTSVVGIFPDGASPFGVLDMSGNLWEWCLNKYEDSPQTKLSQIAIDASGVNRVLRGGAFSFDSGIASAVSRYVNTPLNLADHFGVRVVVGVPI